MKFPSIYAIVMLVCGIVIINISIAIVGINLLNLKEYQFLTQPLHIFYSVLYFVELALMSYVLLLTNDPIRAISYFLYTIIYFLNSIVFAFFPISINLLPILSILNMVILVNAAIQSFFIKNTYISMPYIVFTLSAVTTAAIKMFIPYFTQSIHLPSNHYIKTLAIMELLPSALMLYLVIKIYSLYKLEVKTSY